MRHFALLPVTRKQSRKRFTSSDKVDLRY